MSLVLYRWSCYSNLNHFTHFIIHSSKFNMTAARIRSLNCKCNAAVLLSLGYYGATCEYRLDNLCLVERCQNDATCSGNQTHYRCNCLDGFTGPHCEQNINDCDPDPCPEGVCVDQVNDYLCYCPAGESEIHTHNILETHILEITASRRATCICKS